MQLAAWAAVLACGASAFGQIVADPQGAVSRGEKDNAAAQQQFVDMAERGLELMRRTRAAGSCESFEAATNLFWNSIHFVGVPPGAMPPPGEVRRFANEFAAIRAGGCVQAAEPAPVASAEAILEDLDSLQGLWRGPNGVLWRAEENGPAFAMYREGQPRDPDIDFLGTRKANAVELRFPPGGAYACPADSAPVDLPDSARLTISEDGDALTHSVVSFELTDDCRVIRGEWNPIERFERVFGAVPAAATAAPAPPPPPASAPRPADGIPQCPSRFEGSDLSASGGVCRCPDDGFGAVYGSEVYTADSDVCRAARHAGAIPPEGGVVRLSAAPGRDNYRASERNGVSSYGWGEYHASFRVTRASSPAASPAPAQPPNRAEGPRCPGLVGGWSPDSGFFGRLFFFDAKYVEEGSDRLGLVRDGYVRGISGGQQPDRFVGKLAGGRYSGVWLSNDRPFGTIDIQLSEDARSFAGVLSRTNDGARLPVTAICRETRPGESTDAMMGWLSAERRSPELGGASR